MHWYLIFLSKHISLYALGRLKWILDTIWHFNQNVKIFEWDKLHLTALKKETYFSNRTNFSQLSFQYMFVQMIWKRNKNCVLRDPRHFGVSYKDQVLSKARFAKSVSNWTTYLWQNLFPIGRPIYSKIYSFDESNCWPRK